MNLDRDGARLDSFNPPKMGFGDGEDSEKHLFNTSNFNLDNAEDPFKAVEEPIKPATEPEEAIGGKGDGLQMLMKDAIQKQVNEMIEKQ